VCILKKKILVADDHEDILRVYSLMLGDTYEIIKAENGRDAVEKYKEHRPDLTLMDIAMPVLPGDEAINRILDYDPMANIVAVTAYDYTREQLGVPVFRKGFRVKEFQTMVEAALKRQYKLKR
jgi:CheY-like chemotaxis protein